MSYYQEIKMPTTKLEGLQNFVQLIINQLEEGNAQNALYTAVDLRNDLFSNVNPYADVTDGNGNRLLAELEAKHAKQLGDMMAKAKADGIEEGRKLEKRAMAEKLGLL